MGKFVVANWKMNKTIKEARAFIDEFNAKLPKKYKNWCICAPFTCVFAVFEGLKSAGAVGVQNIYPQEKGAFTGEISPQMALDAGATWAIIGHSERRNLMGETDEFLAKKVKFALESGLKVIFCVGEKLEEHGRLKTVLKAELKALKGIDLSGVVIAYEPIWAIGTGRVASIEDIKRAHLAIIETIEKQNGVTPVVLYGGSVKSSNAGEIMALDEVGGVLVGGASLNADEFVKLIEIGGKYESK